MGVACTEFDVQHLTAPSPDYLRALHVALQVSWQQSGKPASRVADLISRADSRTATLEPCVAAYRDGQLVSACVAVETPGAAALVFAPVVAEGSDASRATIAALEALVEASWSRSVRLLEILTEPDDTASGGVLRKSGFRRLTRLLYLVRGDAPAHSSVCAADDLAWVAYSPAKEGIFCEALEATYVQSLDCPELTGLRSTGEVLAGHRATGIFDPARWWVAKRGDALAGVLLLNGIPDQAALEVVYMGVAQASRGTRVADALLQRAVDEMGRANAKYMALAVDERNGPARHLYSRWGFVQSAGRDAWIITPLET